MLYPLAIEAIQQQLSADQTYWKEKFSGELPVLTLPSYKKRPLVKTYHGATKFYSFSN